MEAAIAPGVMRDNAIVRRRRREAVGGAAVLVALALLPLPIRDVYTQNLIIITVLFAGLAQAWNILGGYCGQISLGHALYLGIGAYVSTMLFVHGGVPPTAGMFAGGAVAGLCALLVGWPCFRLSGHYYAIATVVVGEIGYLLFLNWDWVGAATGIYVPFRGESLIQLQFRTNKLPFHYLALAFAARRLGHRLCDRGQGLGLCLAGDARRCRGRALARRAGVPVQDGGGGDQRVSDRAGGRDLRAVCRLYRPGQHLVGPALDPDRAAGGAGRGRHALGSAGGRSRADPAVGADAVLSRRRRARGGPDDLRRADRGGVARPAGRAGEPVRGRPRP